MRRQLKVAFMTMMEGAEWMSDEGQDDEVDLEEGGQQEWDHHSSNAGFIMPKVRRSVKREEDGG